MWTQKPSFRFEIDNFSEKEGEILSETFVSGGCEWNLSVFPKGEDSLAKNHLSLYLEVSNPESLPTGWKRRTQFYFVALNQSDKELYKSGPKSIQECILFCDEDIAWGFRKAFLLSKFEEEGFLENDKLIIEVYINVFEALAEEDVPKKNETVEINGFHVLPSQVTSVRKLFAEHPDMAKDFKPTNNAVKTAYVNVLLKLVEKLEKPPKSLSETKLTKASSKLSELMDVGFKLKWLESKLDEISPEKKKLEDESRVQKIEERLKNLEAMGLGFKIESLKTKLDEVTLEMNKEDDESRVQKIEERVKNLEAMETGLMFEFLKTTQQLEKRVNNLENETAFDVEHLETKLDDLKTELDEVSSKRTKENSRAEVFEERFKNLEEMEFLSKVEYLETKLGGITMEMNKEDAANESLFQQLVKRVNETVFDFDLLRTELDEVSSERKKENSMANKLEERLKDLEVMELGFKMDALKSNIEEDSLERKKSDDANRSCVQKLEEVFLKMKKSDHHYECRVQQLMELESKVDCLNTKFEEGSLERKKSDDAEESRTKQLEDSVHDIRLMFSCLRDEVYKKKDKSASADGFLLVD
ncbi:hypothetical protein AALP_AA4G219500 [Arabis alpina]|uniref:MATH domain-containing protein n=1 Tax=Arabis alpina TaxID=50452 RepID=A0A087H4U7_ARAAL|nr:hypothetical protein AALP_AA4G219500 [Arabis alpina]